MPYCNGSRKGCPFRTSYDAFERIPTKNKETGIMEMKKVSKDTFWICQKCDLRFCSVCYDHHLKRSKCQHPQRWEDIAEHRKIYNINKKREQELMNEGKITNL